MIIWIYIGHIQRIDKIWFSAHPSQCVNILTITSQMVDEDAKCGQQKNRNDHSGTHSNVDSDSVDSPHRNLLWLLHVMDIGIGMRVMLNLKYANIIFSRNCLNYFWISIKYMQF